MKQQFAADYAHKITLERAKQHAYVYLDRVFVRRVAPDDDAIEGLEQFSEALPDGPGDALQIIDLLDRQGSPATVAQAGGRFFGFVNGGVLPVALAARWLADVWDQNAGLYVASPVAAKLEEVVEAWLKQLFGLPETTVAGFVNGSSAATFCALAAARHRLLQDQHWDVNAKGLNGAPAIRLIAGRQAHATVSKAIALLGFGMDQVEWVDADEQGRIIASMVPSLDHRTILILQAGNVNSGAFDAFEELCTAANKAGAWVHIDGAFGLWAAASPRLRALTTGIGKAQSWAVDGHKTLNVAYDSGIVLCRDREALVNSMQASGSYLMYSERRDGMSYTPEMSRRARAVELWAALRFLGRAGVAELVDGLHRHARQLGKLLAAEEFQILNQVVFNQLLVACDDDALTERVAEHLRHGGECWVGCTQWRGRTAIRVSVCSWATDETDLATTVRAFAAARAACCRRESTLVSV